MSVCFSIFIWLLFFFVSTCSFWTPCLYFPTNQRTDNERRMCVTHVYEARKLIIVYLHSKLLYLHDPCIFQENILLCILKKNRICIGAVLSRFIWVQLFCNIYSFYLLGFSTLSDCIIKKKEMRSRLFMCVQRRVKSPTLVYVHLCIRQEGKQKLHKGLE